MLAGERRESILTSLNTQGQVTVGELARRFRVSEETVRRDLEELEKQGLARRVHGGAMTEGKTRLETPYDTRRRTNVASKQLIARLASELVRDGEYIMMDESSTSFYLATQLKGLKNLTVITNSIEIIGEISHVEGWTVMCTGGVKRFSAPSFAGHVAESMVSGYHVDKAIISCDSVSREAGFTDRHEDTALIKRAMMRSARQVVLLCDHTKLDRTAFARIGSLNEIDYFVTDAPLDAQWRETLLARGVKLICPEEEIK